MMTRPNAVSLFILFTLTGTSDGSSRTAYISDLLGRSDAVCIGTVLNNRALEKGPGRRIFTATGFTVGETFRGMFGETVRAEHRGGELDGRGEEYCGRPVFRRGETYLLFLNRREDGTLYCAARMPDTDPGYTDLLEVLRASENGEPGAGLDVSDQPASPYVTMDLLPGSTGYSSRFLQGDRGEPIEYVVDMDTWPSGITSNQALGAVSNAFAAWSAATTLSFRFGGVESFGMAAPDLNSNDGRIYIQLHDNYGYINPSSTLARGGRSYTYSSSWPQGGLGGRVGTNEFDLTRRGFVVMEHTKASLSMLSSFEEVLCHEIGHVLSLDHSSENSSEPDGMLSEAIMYYIAHLDGRGASLTGWDSNTVHIVHPLADTPPYGYERIIEAVTQPGSPPAYASGANRAGVAAYDLQGGAWPVLLSENRFEGNGIFTLEDGNIVFFTPAGYFGDAEASPGSYYGRCFVRMSDGVNLSPPVAVSVVSFNADGNSDLLQDSWASAYGVSGAASDADDDGLSNYEEWLLDLDPTNAASCLRIALSGETLLWVAKPDELYQLQHSTDLSGGFRAYGNPVIAGSTNEIRTFIPETQAFFRVQRLE
jgi:hypothetical protein